MARTYFSSSIADWLKNLTAESQLAGELHRKTVLLGLLQEVVVAANEASSLEEVIQFTLDQVCAFTGWPIGHVYMQSEAGNDELRSTSLWHLDDPEEFKSFQQATTTATFAPGEGLPGRVFVTGEPAWIADVTEGPDFLRTQAVADAGVQAAFAFPVVMGEEVLAVLEFFSTEAIKPDEPLLEVIAHIGTQLGHVAQRIQTEEMLKRRESQLVEAQQLAHLGSWDWDIKTDTVTWSDELYRIYGLRPQEFDASFEAFIQQVHPDDREVTAETIDRARANYQSFDHKHRIVRPDDTVRVLHSLGHVLSDRAGRPVKMVGTCYDITERVESEKAQQRSQAIVEGLFEAAPDAIVLVDEQGQIVRVNAQTEALFGYDREALLGKPVEILMPARFRDRHVEQRSEYFAAPRARPMGANLELFARREDGGEFPIDATLSPLQLETGTFVISVVRDITRRKGAEEALRQSEARFREIFEKGAIGITLLDPSGRVVVCNPAFQEMLGYNGEELRQLTFADYTHPADLRLSRKLFQDLVEGKRELYRMEKRYLRKDRQIMWGHLTVSLVRDAEGAPQFVIGMVKDITERKQMQAELAEVQHQLMESREAERLHLAQELHDGPVQELYALSYRLRELWEMQPDEASAGQMVAAQADLERVLQTLRTITSELRPPALAPFGMEKAIRSHAEEFCKAHPDLEVQLDLIPDAQRLPEQVRLALFRIYQGALSNIVRHAEASHVSIRFSLDEEQVVLEVRDNGRGFVVPPRWVFLVRQGHLGLAGMAERTEAIGGQIQIVSAPGEGTLVKVVVPCSWETETAIAAGKQPDYKGKD